MLWKLVYFTGLVFSNVCAMFVNSILRADRLLKFLCKGGFIVIETFRTIKLYMLQFDIYRKYFL